MLLLLFIILTLLYAGARFESAMQHAAKAAQNVHNDQPERSVAKGPVAHAKKAKRKHDAGQQGAYNCAVVQVSTQDLAIYAEVEQLNPDNTCCFCPEIGTHSCIVQGRNSVDHWCGNEICQKRFTAVHSNVTQVKNSFVRKVFTKNALTEARKIVMFDYPDSD